MFKYFFYQEDSLPEGVGFDLFGIEHLSWLLIFLVVGIFLCCMYKNADLKKRDRMRKSICFLFITMEFVRITILAVLGKLYAKYLPLHLCDWTIFLSIFYSFKKSKAVADILYSLCLPGAVSALLFCSWNNYPMINFMCIHSFIVHFLMVVFIVMQLVTKDIDIEFNGFIYPVIFSAIVMPPTYFINKIFDTNFWFLNKTTDGSPLRIFENVFGNPWFLIPTVIFGFCVVLCLHLPFLVKEKIKNKKEVLPNAS